MYIAKLHPIAFSIGPLGVHWYGIFMVGAIFGGAYYLIERGKQLGENPDTLSNVIFKTVLWGVVGARLVFVLANDPSWIWTNPIQILRIWDGGLAYDGAVGMGVLALWYQLRKKPLIFNHIVDWTVPGIALGIFMVRIGNIFNHEVLGRMTELGFGRWPEQLWGSFIGVFLILRYFSRERHGASPPGYQFWSAMFYYALLRGVIGETTRDNPLYVWHYVNAHWGLGLTTLMQLFTPPILVLTGLMMWRTWRKSATRLDSQPGAILIAESAPPPLGQRPGRTLVRISGSVSMLGSIPFFIMGIPSIGGYLLGAGVLFWLFTWGWDKRYQAVLTEVPADFEPTGEIYSNPGGMGPVTVWRHGIRRVYRQEPLGAEYDRSHDSQETMETKNQQSVPS